MKKETRTTRMKMLHIIWAINLTKTLRKIKVILLEKENPNASFVKGLDIKQQYAGSTQLTKEKKNNQGNSIKTIPKQTFSKNKQYTSRASLIGENHNQETAMNLSSPEFNNKCKWILDSGATSHMSTYINLMDDLQDESRKITFPDDRFIKSNGIGTVEIYKDDNHLLTLKEVLYVPELNNSLISPDEDKNVYNLRPTTEQGFYYESSLSDEDTSQDDTTSDPTYHPVDSVIKDDSLPIIPTKLEETIYMSQPKGFEYQEEHLKPPDLISRLIPALDIAVWISIVSLSTCESNVEPVNGKMAKSLKLPLKDIALSATQEYFVPGQNFVESFDFMLSKALEF
ncbi:hypothetical protein LAZ67_9002112 [Cordylochernes scorpioides]|uniref:Retrovirus-related Pol polyprotein from transposon TNT 1-94-like beta-barrel domain-containing protein n=1 Tax=Cordylochernes scorpioides TaxID=51811 RepID=A0ABY6KWW9_9ARAC|nr:hypothetical protein LAZ67_9002112 [Cordylochernes scorpioides]